jgi:hypothetical protein
MTHELVYLRQGIILLLLPKKCAIESIVLIFGFDKETTDSPFRHPPVVSPLVKREYEPI